MKLKDICTITTGKLDSNAAVENGNYPFFTCAPMPLRTNSFAFDCKAILIAGNNAQGNFHTNFYHGKFNAYQRTYVLQLANSNFSLEYVYYELGQQLQALRRKSQGSQTKFLTLSLLESIEIPEFSLDHQQHITNIAQTIGV